jgi:hypothetical protein
LPTLLPHPRRLHPLLRPSRLQWGLRCRLCSTSFRPTRCSRFSSTCGSVLWLGITRGPQFLASLSPLCSLFTLFDVFLYSHLFRGFSYSICAPSGAYMRLSFLFAGPWGPICVLLLLYARFWMLICVPLCLYARLSVLSCVVLCPLPFSPALGLILLSACRHGVVSDLFSASSCPVGFAACFASCGVRFAGSGARSTSCRSCYAT